MASTHVLKEEEVIALMLLDLFVTKGKIPVIKWITRNKKMDSLHLQKFFDRFIDKTMNLLNTEIKIPTFESLKENLKIKWSDILTNP